MSTYTPHPDDLEEPPIREDWRRIADGVLPGNREQLAEQRAEQTWWPARLDTGSLQDVAIVGMDLARGRDITVVWGARELAAARQFAAIRSAISAGVLDLRITTAAGNDADSMWAARRRSMP